MVTPKKLNNEKKIQIWRFPSEIIVILSIYMCVNIFIFFIVDMFLNPLFVETLIKNLSARPFVVKNANHKNKSEWGWSIKKILQ